VDLTKYLEETTFAFDHAYDERSSNEQIYAQCIRPLVHNAFQGAKISCFAYGQTGSGKTFTMKGDIKQGVPGLYYLGAAEIFRLLEEVPLLSYSPNTHICTSPSPSTKSTAKNSTICSTIAQNCLSDRTKIRTSTSSAWKKRKSAQRSNSWKSSNTAAPSESLLKMPPTLTPHVHTPFCKSV
jgi:Kinesin motor domain